VQPVAAVVAAASVTVALTTKASSRHQAFEVPAFSMGQSSLAGKSSSEKQIPGHGVEEASSERRRSVFRSCDSICQNGGLAVLVALFLLGAKWTIDVVGEWPPKKSVSNHFTEQHSPIHR
jgi:hypothetical protein